MTFQYKGRGFLQGTGRSNMATSPITIGNQGYTAQVLKHLNSVNSISLNNSNLTSSSGAFGTFEFDTFGKTHELLKKYEVYESTEDVMTLGVAAHREFEETKSFYKLTDRQLYNKIIPQDRQMAQDIRDYYSKKVMMLKLKGTGTLSPFREDMNKLIHSDGLTFKESMFGIAYWMPKFYEYDLALDKIKEQVTTTQDFEKFDKQGVVSTKQLSVTLTPLKRLRRATKRNKFFEYWFKDDTLNAGVVLHLEDKNQLQHLWDYMFENESSIKIKGNYIRRHRDGFEYFSISNWEIDRS